LNDLEQRVLSKLDRDELVRITKEIVAILSPTGGEQGVADYIAGLFRGLGLQVRTQEVEPGRSNVICTWKGSGGGQSLLFTGHMDTSRGYADTMIEDGDWLFGPGATNMKGCFTAAYAATKMLMEAGVPCSRVNNFQEVFANPHIRARNVIEDVTHPRMGTTRTVRNPVLFDHDGPSIRRPAPLLGEHSAEILRELGYSAAEIEGFSRAGAVLVAN